MGRMPGSPHIQGAVLIVCIAIPGALAHSAELVHLKRSGDVASLIKSRGPGRESFELIVRAAWAIRSGGTYSLRVLLPDGHAEARALPAEEGPGGRQMIAWIPAGAVRNIRPNELVVRLSVIDAASGAEVSNMLELGINDFPRVRPHDSGEDPGPFGWGRPLGGGAGSASPLTRTGPDGWRFVRVHSAAGEPAFFIGDAEASNAQVGSRLPDYDPRAGRSDDFELEAADQPAVGLTPDRAKAYLAALSAADPAHLPYRLPTRDEWLRAARAGRAAAFWWGDQPAYPQGANFHGPEPALSAETTARCRPVDGAAGFKPNPWGLMHTFGNISEWATGPAGGFVQLGGNFRTEPESPLAEVPVTKGSALGDVPYVGVRPVFSLDARTGAELVRKRLAGNGSLQAVRVAFDPDGAMAVLSGRLPESRLRRTADELLASLWFLEGVDNQIETPTLAAGQLARLGGIAGTIRRLTPMGRWFYEIPLEVHWADPLAVEGSEWWVNVYLPNGGAYAHRMVESRPGRTDRVVVLIDKAKLAAAGLPADAPVSVALSLGREALNPADRQVVSNLAPIRWRVVR
jgi:hypothetical protein